jgi:hypothetical protein
MNSRKIEIPEIGFVTLYKRRGSRSLRLSVATDGEVRVSMPHWVPYVAGEKFARSRADWIAEHITPANSLTHGQSVGKAHRLHFATSAQAARISTRLRDNLVEITHPQSLESHHPSVQQAARSASLRALKAEAERLLPQRLNHLASQTDLSYSGLTVRQLKSRWGSCSSQKHITLNFFLMQLPWHLIDYVLLHELAHTKVLRHGPPFWAELEKHAPGARKLRKEIGAYRPALVA